MTANPETSFLVTLIDSLAPDINKVRDWVKEIKRENPGLTREQIAEYVADSIVWLYTKQGAALALPGAVPGLGTLVQLGVEAGSISVDVTLMIRNQTYLTFAIAECYGNKGRETLIQDTLICMGLWTNALTLTKGGLMKIGSKAVEANFRRRFPAEILKRVNRKVGTTIVTKYGTKRGGVALGKLIPFGVGVLIGGGFSYLTMKSFAASARRYFALKVDESNA